MNNQEKLQQMPLDTLAEWLDAYGQFDGSPWMKWFDKNHCSKCPSEIVTYSRKCFDSDVEEQVELECAYCEIYHTCRMLNDAEPPDNFTIIKMWLEVNSEDDK